MSRVRYPTLADWKNQVLCSGVEGKRDSSVPPWASCVGSLKQWSVCVCIYPSVLCTAPAKYTVFDAEGYVKPQSCIDM